MFMDKAQWYVVHTYSGYENKVKTNIEKTVENRNMHDRIIEVKLPEEEVIEVKDNVSKAVKRKLFPGYVFVRMNLYKPAAFDTVPELDENVWHFITGIKGVSRIGGEMSADEVAQWISIPGAEAAVPLPSARPTFNVGDQVEIVEGVFQGSKGVVQEVDVEHGILRVETMMFNRANSIELEPSKVEKIVD